MEALNCQFVVVIDRDLPVGHRFLLVTTTSGDSLAYGFSLEDDQSQLEVRIAALEWERTQMSARDR